MLTKYVLSLKDREQWSSCLKKLPDNMQDVYYTPEYYEIYEKNGDGKAICFVYENGDDLALYPFLLNRINDLGYNLDKDYYDIQGAYGYNGVVYSSDNPEFIRNFYNEFNQFCSDNNIVAEFTRFHPLLENHKFSIDYLEISYNRQTVYLDLKKGYDKIVNEFSYPVRKNLINAKNNNLTVLKFEETFPFKKEFSELYRQNMHRVNAESCLNFNDMYFENTFKNLPLTQFIIFKDDSPIASSLVFRYGKYLNHHLTASLGNYLHLRPNDLLYDSIIKYGVENGYATLYLGGGRTTDEKDSLLQFKRKFSESSKGFYIGKKVHNKEILGKIYEQWEVKFSNLINKYKNTLLRYRNLFIIIILTLV
jgi:lipid II:glycine glycyltransferase (peptidoglycan interpeptide bridge formation enzyme)